MSLKNKWLPRATESLLLDPAEPLDRPRLGFPRPTMLCLRGLPALCLMSIFFRVALCFFASGPCTVLDHHVAYSDLALNLPFLRHGLPSISAPSISL